MTGASFDPHRQTWFAKSWTSLSRWYLLTFRGARFQGWGRALPFPAPFCRSSSGGTAERVHRFVEVVEVDPY